MVCAYTSTVCWNIVFTIFYFRCQLGIPRYEWWRSGRISRMSRLMCHRPMLVLIAPSMRFVKVTGQFPLPFPPHGYRTRYLSAASTPTVFWTRCEHGFAFAWNNSNTSCAAWLFFHLLGYSQPQPPNTWARGRKGRTIKTVYSRWHCCVFAECPFYFIVGWCQR